MLQRYSVKLPGGRFFGIITYNENVPNNLKMCRNNVAEAIDMYKGVEVCFYPYLQDFY